MSTAQQYEAMRSELGLSVHSLHAAGSEPSSEADSDDERWQCVRAMRESAEQPRIRCHRAIETALGFDEDPDSSPMIESDLEKVVYNCGAEESIGALSMAGIQTIAEAADYCPAEMQKAMEESAGVQISLSLCTRIVHESIQVRDAIHLQSRA